MWWFFEGFGCLKSKFLDPGLMRTWDIRPTSFLGRHQIRRKNGYWKMSHGWSGWWLTYPSEKYDFVSWEYDIPNIWKIQNVPNHQPVDAWFDVFVLKIITSCGWETLSSSGSMNWIGKMNTAPFTTNNPIIHDRQVEGIVNPIIVSIISNIPYQIYHISNIKYQIALNYIALWLCST